jgi:hypothetical protein
MTNKNDYIEQARKANPAPQFADVNGDRVQLTNEQYEASLEAWAQMQLEQDAVEAQRQAAAAAKESARAKLSALGLTDKEIAALVG